MGGLPFDGEPEIVTFVRGDACNAQATLAIISAPLEDEAESITDSLIAQARAELGAQLGDELHVERRTLGSGHDAMQIHGRITDGSGEVVVLRILAVPLGDRGIVVIHAAQEAADDELLWAGVVAGLHVDDGRPWWHYAGFGALLLIVLLVGRTLIAGRGPRSMAPGGFGTRALDDGPWSRPTEHAAAPMPSPSTSAAPGAVEPSSAPAPAPAQVRAASTAPQIPGLRSTLPPSGRWGEN